LPGFVWPDTVKGQVLARLRLALDMNYWVNYRPMYWAGSTQYYYALSKSW